MPSLMYVVLIKEKDPTESTTLGKISFILGVVVMCISFSMEIYRLCK
ncbi:MAG: hypothetical protein MJ252_05905 [archaeon]|nr:hypothetical protein [archaeon]